MPYHTHSDITEVYSLHDALALGNHPLRDLTARACAESLLMRGEQIEVMSRRVQSLRSDSHIFKEVSK